MNEVTDTAVMDALEEAASPVPQLPVLNLGLASGLAALSAPLSAVGLALLRLSAQSRSKGRRSRNGCGHSGQRETSGAYPLWVSSVMAVSGCLLLFMGLAMSCLPLVMASKSYGGLSVVAFNTRLARMLQCVQVLFCWALERYVVSREPLPPLQGTTTIATWIFCTLVEWAGPLPEDDLSQVLFRQKAGCDGGFRALFRFLYLPAWSTVLSFGLLMVVCVGPAWLVDPSLEDDDEDATDGGAHVPLRNGEAMTPREELRKNTMRRSAEETPSRVFCRIMLPFISGFAVSGAGLLFATAYGTRSCEDGWCPFLGDRTTSHTLDLDDLVFATDSIFRDGRVWLASGCLLLLLAVACAVHWTFRLGLSLGSWAPLSQCATMQLTLLQGHLLFRNYQWDNGDPLIQPLLYLPIPVVYIYLVSFTVTLGIVLLYLLTAEWSEWTKSTCDDLVDGETAPHFSRNLTLTNLQAGFHGQEMGQHTPEHRAQIHTATLVGLLCFLLLLYSQAITTPLYHYHICAPDVQWLNGRKAIDEFANQPGKEESCIVNKMSFIDQITWYYDKQMPFSAMLAAYSSVVGPPLEFVALLVVIASPPTLPPLIMSALRDWLSGTAATKFATPMLYMLGVTLIQYADPGGHSFRAQFTQGFACLMLYCLTFGIMVKMLEQPPKSVRELPTRADPEENAVDESQSDGEKSPRTLGSSSDDGSDEDLECCGDMEWCKFENIGYPGLIFIFCLLFGSVMVATYYGLSTPLLSFDVRYSDALVLQFAPTLLELWHTLKEENWILSCFAAATLVFTVPLRILLIVLNRTLLHEKPEGKKKVKEEWCTASSLVRRAERLTKQFSLGHIWAESIFLVWLYIFTKNKDETQFCARMPTPPIGLLAIAALGVGVPSAGHLLDMIQMVGLTPFSPGRRLSHLPGGGVLWGGGPFCFAVMCIYVLSINGPPPSSDIEDLAGLNLVLKDRILPKFNERIHRSMPGAMGLCGEMREESYRDSITSGFRPTFGMSVNLSNASFNCVGHSPLAQFHKDGSTVTVKWATGLNELQITNMSVLPPSRVGLHSHLWTLAVSGVFTNLHVWIHAMSLNEFMCCDEDTSFTIHASAPCHDTTGFGPIELSIVKVDRPEIGHTDSWKGSNSEGRFQVDFGSVEDVSHTDIKAMIQTYITSGEGKLMMKFTEGPPKDVMEYMRHKLNNIMQLNRDGRMCPPAENEPSTFTTTTSTAVRILE